MMIQETRVDDDVIKKNLLYHYITIARHEITLQNTVISF